MAQLAIEPHPDSHCAVVDQGRDAETVTHHVKTDRSRGSDGVAPAEGGDRTGQSRRRGGADTDGCSECHAQMTFEGGEGAYLTSPIGRHCICPVFEAHDCIPEFEAVRSGSIVVTLTIRARAVLRDIIAGLRAGGASVTIDWLVDGSASSSTTEIDVSAVTDKQQETLELALDSGYYKTPREADLGDLATELGISKSAASQRLNAAETKLVRAFLDEYD